MTGVEMISLYAPDSPYTVYNEEIWWGDSWDPMDYGKEIEFGRSFFEQFGELRLSVPRRSMQHNGITENCDYTAYGNGNRIAICLLQASFARTCTTAPGW